MRPGDHVLITAASGGVGRAAMQIANQIGAVPIAVTRHTAKKDELLAAGAAAVIATDHDGRRRSRPPPHRRDAPTSSSTSSWAPASRISWRRPAPARTLVAAGFLDPRPTRPSREAAAHDLRLPELRAHPRRRRGGAHGGLPERRCTPRRTAARHRQGVRPRRRRRGAPPPGEGTPRREEDRRHGLGTGPEGAAFKEVGWLAGQTGRDRLMCWWAGLSGWLFICCTTVDTDRWAGACPAVALLSPPG